MPLPDVCYFISDPPEFEYRGGMFHVTQRFGDNLSIERVMSPHLFMLALKRAAECAKKHRFGGAEIIDFPANKDEAASAGH
jgi:hypothetical protein